MEFFLIERNLFQVLKCFTGVFVMGARILNVINFLTIGLMALSSRSNAGSVADVDANAIVNSGGNSKVEPKIFDGIWDSVGDSFGLSKMPLHFAGLLSTGALVSNGTDAKVYDFFRKSSGDEAWPGAIVGSGAGAAVAGLSLYWKGRESGDHETIGAAYVVAQATLLTAVYVKTLKMLTGRAHPTHSSPLTSQQQAESFQLGAMQLANGYGWPSGHVSHTVAVTAALAHYYPDKSWLTWSSIGLSAYMLYTVSAFHSGQMHWFSDGVAGAFMGYAIGSCVGTNFRKQLGHSKEATNDSLKSDFHWAPLFLADHLGLRWSKTF